MKAKIIVALIGATATVASAIISFNIGKNAEYKEIQNQINNAFGEVVNVVGDGNDVSINDISNFVSDYLKLKEQNINFKCTIAMKKDCSGKGVIQIKADDEIVYTSQEITNLTDPNENKIDIPINHASKLTISCIGNYNSCNIFIADTILHN